MVPQGINGPGARTRVTCATTPPASLRTPQRAARLGGVAALCARHFTALACLVLALAAFNLTFRLGSEFLTEWDESLYATAASEAVDAGHWIGTTMEGELDYYNTKPPLNVWLIALTFKVFGKSLIALRLISVVAAWLTVLVLLIWTRRSLGPVTALLAGVVLATSFGFIHIHAGRSANTDALFTLIVLLTVVVAVGGATRRGGRASGSGRCSPPRFCCAAWPC